MLQKIGRPKKLTPNSATAKLFLDLYLDPTVPVNQVVQICGLSRATFYNYIRELDLPVLKVAIGAPKPDLPLAWCLRSFEGNYEKYDLDFVRGLGSVLKCRIELKPISSAHARPALTTVRSKTVDFALSSLCATPARRQEFGFSNDYFKHTDVDGVLLKRKNTALQSISNRKLTLAVTIESSHEEFANRHFQSDYRLRSYRSELFAFEALKCGRVSLMLTHPSWLDSTYFVDRDKFEICSKPFYYGSPAGIVFNPDRVDLIPSVNRAIDEILNR